MRSFTGDKCLTAPAVQGMYRSERDSVQHCFPFGVGFYAWHLGSLADEGAKGRTLEGREVPNWPGRLCSEAPGWAFVLGYLALSLSAL